MKILLAAVCLLQVGMSGQTFTQIHGTGPFAAGESGETLCLCTGCARLAPAPVLSAPLPDRIEDQWQYESCEGSCTPIPEPEDVPAIQEPCHLLTTTLCLHKDDSWDYDIGGLPSANFCTATGDHYERRTICDGKWTCAEKSRILETAENGRKWCRKVIK
jgi:hypothetical protein